MIANVNDITNDNKEIIITKYFLILALKTMFTNMKQNIITFIVVGLLVFCGTISLVMMQNFSIKPKLSLLSFELCDGAIVADSDKELDIFNYTKTIDHVQNVRLCTNGMAEVEDTKLLTYVINNNGNLKNQDVCYEGRLPKYDNEIAVAGKFASNYEHKIGDEIELGVGNRKEKFIITGLIQTTNNNGTEAVIIEDGGKKIFGEDFVKVYFFDIDDGGDVDKILEDVKDKFGERISSTINFEKIMEGSITIFKTISNLMVVAMLSVSGLVILLVLYLLIKTLINNKKKDYGILKAVGFTSRNVVMQNAISFMPPIILSTICSCILSSRFANAYLTLMMRAFGIMKATFEVPVVFVVYMGIGFMLVSFIFAILLSRKIRKIEPVDLLKGE